MKKSRRFKHIKLKKSEVKGSKSQFVASINSKQWNYISRNHLYDDVLMLAEDPESLKAFLKDIDDFEL